MSSSFHRGELLADVSLRGASRPEPARRSAAAAQLQGDDSRLVFLTEPCGVAVEQYKILRHRLTRLHPRGGVMLVTSPGPAEGKTLTSANLAWCLAAAGHSTCLVDLDFRAPGLSEVLGMQREEFGVEDVLTGMCRVQQVIRPAGDLPFAVLPIRRRSASPGSMLAPASITPLLDKLRSMHEWVLLDLAPALPMADVAELLPHVDGALLVVRCAKTNKALIAPTIDVLGSALWGVVFNDAVISGSEYYGSYGKSRG